MAADAHAAADFYGTARGAVAARLLRERLSLMWPDLRGQSVLGVCFAAPYMRNWRVVLRTARLFERTGRKSLTGFAGVPITEAVKDIYAAMPVEAVPRRRLVLAEAA